MTFDELKQFFESVANATDSPNEYQWNGLGEALVELVEEVERRLEVAEDVDVKLAATIAAFLHTPENAATRNELAARLSRALGNDCHHWIDRLNTFNLTAERRALERAADKLNEEAHLCRGTPNEDGLGLAAGIVRDLIPD